VHCEDGLISVAVSGTDWFAAA